MANEVSKKEFLKRYLENEEESSHQRKKKSKIVKPKANIPCLKIVNEDIDLKSMNFGEKDDDDNEDEAPVVAEIIDERPIEVKLKEVYDSSHWKQINNCESSQSEFSDQQKTTTYDRCSKNRRHDSDEDLSPLKEHRQSLNASISSPSSHKQYNRRHDSDSDISPPRNSKLSRSKNKSDNDILQSQSRDKHNSDSDLSPPRNRKQSKNKHNSDSDLSPPQNQKQHSSQHNSDSDLSPPRNQKKIKSKHNSDSDLSPPRSHKNSSTREKSKLDKTLSGLKAGLQNAKSLQQEVEELRNREKSRLNMLGDELSGRTAKTIIRDRKTGKKRDLNKELEIKDEEDKKKKEYLQKYEKWGKGTETRDEHLEKLKDEIHEMEKPLARYQDDADLDDRLRSVFHDEDPMLEYMKKKRQKNDKTSSFPVYTGPPAAPNRFNIKPGYRWDGVDRSNGFEAKYFEKINQTKAVKDEAYLWSVQDM